MKLGKVVDVIETVASAREIPDDLRVGADRDVAHSASADPDSAVVTDGPVPLVID